MYLEPENKEKQTKSGEEVEEKKVDLEKSEQAKEDSALTYHKFFLFNKH
jgi:hypothetical protein